jgi:hypothetical protein
MRRTSFLTPTFVITRILRSVSGHKITLSSFQVQFQAGRDFYGKCGFRYHFQLFIHKKTSPDELNKNEILFLVKNAPLFLAHSGFAVSSLDL